MKVCVLSVLLATWVHSVFGLSIEIHPPFPLVNQTVILNVLNINGAFRFLEWYLGQNTNATNQIIRINSAGGIINGTKFFKEASVFPNGSLQIRDVQRRNEGYYTVSVQADSLEQASVQLKIYDLTEGGGLSPGAIVGICIGVIAAVAIVIGASVCVYKNKCAKAANGRRPDVL